MPEYNNNDIQQLENRVDNLEIRMTKVETTLQDLKMQCANGFSDIKNDIQNLYFERTEWGKFARSSLTSIGKWCGKYGSIILLVALGLGNAEKIIQIFI